MLHEFPNHETLNTVSKAFIEIAENSFLVNLTPAEPYSLFYYARVFKALEKNVRK